MLFNPDTCDLRHDILDEAHLSSIIVNITGFVCKRWRNNRTAPSNIHLEGTQVHTTYLRLAWALATFDLLGLTCKHPCYNCLIKTIRGRRNTVRCMKDMFGLRICIDKRLTYTCISANLCMAHPTIERF
jgi:hypothetical protein